MVRIHGFTALTGGTLGCLDYLTTARASDGDRSLGVDADNRFCSYVFDADSLEASNSPSVIAPISGPGRWLLVSQPYVPYGTGATATDMQTELRKNIRTSNYSTFATAKTAAAGKTLIVDSTVSIETSDDTDVPVLIQYPGNFVVASGQTLTINSSFSCGLFSCFSGSGSVLFSDGSVLHVLPQWFGAVPDGSTDCTAAIQAAINSLGSNGGLVCLTAGTYKVTSVININCDCVAIRGVGRGASGYGIDAEKNSSTLIYTHALSGNVLDFNCDYGGVVEDLTIRGTDSHASGYAISLAGATSGTFNAYAHITNVTIQNTNGGIDAGNTVVLNLTNSHILGHSAIGLLLGNPNAPDSGGVSITGCNFITSGATATHIKQQSAGGLRISNTKFLGAKYGIYTYLSSGVATSILLITGCSIENFLTYGLYTSSAGGGAEYRYISITGTQFATIAGSTACIITGPTATANNMTITGCSFGCTAGGYGISFTTGENISISGNSFYGDGSNTAIGLGPSVLTTVITGNIFKNFSVNLLNSSTGRVLSTHNLSDDVIQSVASASPLVIPDDGDVFYITGTTNFSSISRYYQSGRVIILRFADVLTITASTTLKLSASFTTSADDTLMLYCTGTAYYELSRSVN